MSVYPITFSIPSSKIVNDIPSKSKLISSLIPGKMETYIYNTESEYYNEYKTSVFATTTKKGGWDCMRHYEILACGAIPYFPDIEKCPENTMFFLPKTLIQYGNTLYEKYRNKELSEIDINVCNDLIKLLLEYTRENLTTDKIANYILNTVKHPDVKKILYLSSSTSPDYLRCVTLHGFKSIFGKMVHDYPKIPHIYQSDNINYSNLYGKGISYTNLISENLHDDTLDASIKEDILNKHYDLIIYASYHRGMPFFDIVSSVYSPDKIVIICGEDEHNCDYINFTNKGHHVFVRELK